MHHTVASLTKQDQIEQIMPITPLRSIDDMVNLKIVVRAADPTMVISTIDIVPNATWDAGRPHRYLVYFPFV